MAERQFELTRDTLAVVFLFALIAASVWICRPFLAAVVWATMIVVATWPILLTLQRWLLGRRWLAVTGMTLLLLVIFVLPFSFAIVAVAENFDRYESCIVNTAEDVSRFVREVNHPKVRALLDTYHMNIEESDLEKAFLTVQDCLEVVHFADSNRRALGRGHIDFRPVVSGMKAIGFDKTIVLESTAPGPDPFRADKGGSTGQTMATYAKESLAKLKEWFA